MSKLPVARLLVPVTVVAIMVSGCGATSQSVQQSDAPPVARNAAPSTEEDVEEIPGIGDVVSTGSDIASFIYCLNPPAGDESCTSDSEKLDEVLDRVRNIQAVVTQMRQESKNGFNKVYEELKRQDFDRTYASLRPVFVNTPDAFRAMSVMGICAQAIKSGQTDCVVPGWQGRESGLAQPQRTADAASELRTQSQAFWTASKNLPTDTNTTLETFKPATGGNGLLPQAWKVLTAHQNAELGSSVDQNEVAPAIFTPSFVKHWNPVLRYYAGLMGQFVAVRAAALKMTALGATTTDSTQRERDAAAGELVALEAHAAMLPQLADGWELPDVGANQLLFSSVRATNTKTESSDPSAPPVFYRTTLNAVPGDPTSDQAPWAADVIAISTIINKHLGADGYVQLQESIPGTLPANAAGSDVWAARTKVTPTELASSWGADVPKIKEATVSGTSDQRTVNRIDPNGTKTCPTGVRFFSSTGSHDKYWYDKGTIEFPGGGKSAPFSKHIGAATRVGLADGTLVDLEDEFAKLTPANAMYFPWSWIRTDIAVNSPSDLNLWTTGRYPQKRMSTYAWVGAGLSIPCAAGDQPYANVTIDTPEFSPVVEAAKDFNSLIGLKR